MIRLFTAKDFSFNHTHGINDPMQVFADQANAKIQKLIDESPVVYGYVKSNGKPNYWGPRENGQFDDTHIGRVLFIEPIEKLPCVHKPALVTRDDFVNFCKFCGVELVATWNEVK